MQAPDPVATRHDEPYWKAAGEGRLLLQRTRDGRFHFPPRSDGPGFDSGELEWVESAGTGVVYSFTVVSRSFFENLPAPYVLAIVELDEGPRLTTHLVGLQPEDVAIGMRVKAGFQAREDRLPLLVFRRLDR